MTWLCEFVKSDGSTLEVPFGGETTDTIRAAAEAFALSRTKQYGHLTVGRISQVPEGVQFTNYSFKAPNTVRPTVVLGALAAPENE